MPALFLLVIISSSLAFEQMVTLQLLSQHEQDKGQSSSEEEEEDEERPRRPSVSGSAGPPAAPLSRETQEPPSLSSEQAIREAVPPPPRALPTPQEGVQGRDGEPSEAEALPEIKEVSLSPELTGIPSQRVLGPPTSVPPLPPGPVVVDSECEETLAASPLENACVEEPESSMRPSLTSHPRKGDPLDLGSRSPGEEPQPPELKEDKDVASPAVPCREPGGTEAGFPVVGAAGRPSHCSQHTRYVCAAVSRTRRLHVQVAAGFSRADNSSSEMDFLIHFFIHLCNVRGSVVGTVIGW